LGLRAYRTGYRRISAVVGAMSGKSGSDACEQRKSRPLQTNDVLRQGLPNLFSPGPGIA